MNKVKQVIVVRGDLDKLLKFKGKLAAQVSHASLGALFKNSTYYRGECGDSLLRKCIPVLNGDVLQWFDKEFTKVVVKCKDEKELLEIYEKVKNSEHEVLRTYHSLIKDAGHTVFDQPTLTCLGIGPAPSNIIDEITGKLPLL